MNTTVLDYRISEFETEQEASDYERWFSQKVDEGLACTKLFTHDEVLQILQNRRQELMKKC